MVCLLFLRKFLVYMLRFSDTMLIYNKLEVETK